MGELMYVNGLSAWCAPGAQDQHRTGRRTGSRAFFLGRRNEPSSHGTKAQARRSAGPRHRTYTHVVGTGGRVGCCCWSVHGVALFFLPCPLYLIRTLGSLDVDLCRTRQCPSSEPCVFHVRSTQYWAPPEQRRAGAKLVDNVLREAIDDLHCGY